MLQHATLRQLILSVIKANQHKSSCMKKTCLPIVVIISVSFILQGCIKDTCESSHQYSYYSPLYKTKAAVKANIKSNPSRQIANTGKIFTIGNYIFLNEIDKGIHVIDNSNPSSPKNIAFIDIPGNMDIAVKGNILYADVFTDMVALDISNPLNVTVTKFIEGVFPFRYWGGGLAADTNMVIVDWVKRDTIVYQNCNSMGQVYLGREVYFDRSQALNNSSGNGQVKSSSPVGTGGSMARFALLNSRLYTVSNQDLNIFNITTPETPVYVKKVAVSNWNVETLFPFENKLFIGSSNGMFIYSVNSADNTELEGQFAHVRSCDPVIADDHFAYVTLSSGSQCGGFTNQMDVLNISNISNPVLVKSYPLTSPHGLSKDKNVLFVCDGTDGLKIFDASDAGNIITLKQITGFETYDVIANNNKAIVIAKDGLYQYNYADVNNIKLLSKLTIVKD